MKQRLDHEVVRRGLVATRSQAESYIRMGKVEVAGAVQKKPGFLVAPETAIRLTAAEQYVSRAGLKLASVVELFGVDFRDKTVLDVGSSTGGFTDYALKHGARKVFAVDVGTNQLHPSLHGNPQIELHEQTDIRNFTTNESIDIVVVDVSFISLREILSHVASMLSADSVVLAMVKPQFEATAARVKHKGVIKNDKMRRQILQDFELWARQHFIVVNKADSGVPGEKGNVERFYYLKVVAK